ncbi:hypothetical protein ABZ863_13995 [Saccharomonospora sp. NPDC046836]|uniref:hypothetical protein n=1 Tax=Saccharomonospora sp. NPDC046836 TaxID=3156921 RepID=UPI0034023F55
MPPMSWKVLGVAAVTGILIVLLSWWSGPSLFGTPEAEQTRTVRATVTLPAECTDPAAEETVRFELDGTTRNGTLSGCGHDQDEQVEIAVPATVGDGLLEVQLASTAPGTTDLKRPMGLALLVLSCASGGTYAFLVARGPRRPAAVL